ncbi:MAG TPA: choice-of-anchor P family protein [Gemmatimonadales bacterium]|jgi:hypothetical protein|nr:choice-of-anchor P family protein [Gemmatimonadales bacterium]
MKRTAFLALVPALVAGCEKPTAPASVPRPEAELVAPAATTYSGRAIVVQATLLNAESIRLGDTGELPAEGGALDGSLATVGVSKETNGILGLSAVVGEATTVGQGSTSSAAASVANVSMDVANNTVTASLLRAQAEATCDGQGRATVRGSSQLAELVVNNEVIDVTGAPNQEIKLPNGRIIINEQSSRVDGNQAEITVNALHVTTFVPLSGDVLADVVISSAHADITCAAAPCSFPPPAGDFVTGGGWIETSAGARANFGVGGGIKQNGNWGHLTYIDHGSNGPKVKGTGVTGYEVTGEFSRRITGTAEVDGVGGFTYIVNVTDNGEPGREDIFTIDVPSRYHASGNLAGGNIQLHPRPSACP